MTGLPARPLRRLSAAAVLLCALVPLLPAAQSRAASYTECDAASGAPMTIKQADDLLANRYTFPPHRTVILPSNLRWTENPLHDFNWQLRLHQMHWTEPLWYA